jgi:hypothetical protein
MASQFEQQVMQELPLSVPYDERSVLAAMHDDRVVSIKAVKQAHQATQQSDDQAVEQHWQQLAEHHDQLAQLQTKQNQHKSDQPAQPAQPAQPGRPYQTNRTTTSTSNNSYPAFRSNIRDKVLRHAAHMVHDVKHYSKLPFGSHGEKLKHCFVQHNRIFVSMAMLLIVLFLVFLVIIVTRKSTNI